MTLDYALPKMTDAASKKLVATADLHSHILPAWDDGPKTFAESLRMAQMAVEGGITHILATPHVAKATETEYPASEIPGAVGRLEKALREEGVDITIVPGAEIMLSDSGIAARIGAEPWLTVGGQGRYALVETPMRSWADHMDQTLFEISLHNVVPIIAHPERLTDAHKDINILEQTVASGALLQITARYLQPRGDQHETADCCRRLLEAGYISLIASDAHSSRTLLQHQVADALCEIVGETAAYTILVENPRRVLAGEPAAPPQPDLRKPAKTGLRGLWESWTRR